MGDIKILAKITSIAELRSDGGLVKLLTSLVPFVTIHISGASHLA
jgi:hypothetical protein